MSSLSRRRRAVPSSSSMTQGRSMSVASSHGSVVVTVLVMSLFVLTDFTTSFSLTSATLPRQHQQCRFMTGSLRRHSSSHICARADDDDDMTPKSTDASTTPTTGRRQALSSILCAAMIATTTVSSPLKSYADEYGRESEAPTLFTGETVEICVKRGPLGACTKTELRTAENENDKSEKYFKQPTELVKRKDDEARRSESDTDSGNALIERLKQQTEDNREKNELLVKQRTMVNDASASFGPFDGQVLILNEDGKGFTLLANPQAMRLKKAGLIGDDKKFTRQPTQEELDSALEAGPNLFDRFFGGSGDEP